jgi:hypothetical protein
MTAIQVEWRGLDDIERGLDNYVIRIHETIKAVADYFAPQLETYAKDNAPWTDRTGNARQGLTGLVDDVAVSIVDLYLTHSPAIFYGKFLELSYSGRYSIILPTMEAHYDNIFKLLQQALDRT